MNKEPQGPCASPLALDIDIVYANFKGSGDSQYNSYMFLVHCGLQSQKAVTAYFPSRQLLPFNFARLHCFKLFLRYT